MRIAFTADLHLTTQARDPERFLALEDILRQCGERQVQLLVIAGDLFDRTMASYPDFEELYQRCRPQDLRTVIIPGNHDLGLTGGSLAGERLTVHAEPVLEPGDDTRLLLFLPYAPDQTMGEAIAPFARELAGKRWILIGHGDLTGSLASPDPYEPGTYMPLTRSDLKLYQPELAVLGHIHLSQQQGVVHYPGSPCPVNAGETGPRRFLILDTIQGELQSCPVNSPLEYYREHFIMLPAENDLEILLAEIKDRIQSWQAAPERQEAIRVSVRISGSALSDRGLILDRVKEAFSAFRFLDERGPDLEGLGHSQDPDRAEISRQLKIWLEELDLPAGDINPTRAEVLEKALQIIYRTGV